MGDMDQLNSEDFMKELVACVPTTTTITTTTTTTSTTTTTTTPATPGNVNETCLDKPAEIAFVVDSSGSMNEKNAWRQVKTWLEALVDAYKIDGTTRKGGLVVW